MIRLPAQQYHGVCIEHYQFQKHRTLQLKSTSESKSNLLSVPNGETEAREEARFMDLMEWLRLLASWQGLSLLPHRVPWEGPISHESLKRLSPHSEATC